MNAALIEQTRYGFTQEQIDVIKATIAPKTSNEELSLFLMVCQKSGLDPFSRQIYLSERKSKDPATGLWTVKKSPETTIDGFRVIAERTGQYRGQEGPFWCGPDGEWKDVWLGKTMPSAAKVGVLRQGFDKPVWAVALFEEYVQLDKDGNPNRMWQKMGANQLAKCAESLALRKAFPRDLSGMYSREEMGQSEATAKEAQHDVAQRKIAELRQIPAGSTISPQDIADTEPDFSELDKHTISTAPPRLDGPMNVNSNMAEYEQRQAAFRAEADAALNEGKKHARKRGSIPFDALKHFGVIKKALREETGDDAEYYRILKGYGYDHADEIVDKEEARTIYKTMAGAHARMVQDAELQNTLTNAQEALGIPKFIAILGAHGCENVTQVLAMDGTPLENLLGELKQAIADQKGKE